MLMVKSNCFQYFIGPQNGSMIRILIDFVCLSIFGLTTKSDPGVLKEACVETQRIRIHNMKLLKVQDETHTFSRELNN